MWVDETGLLRRKCDPDPFAIRRYVRRRDRWTIWMGGARRSGDGLRMVSVGGAGRSGDGLRMVSRANLVSRVCVYVDWRGWEVWGWVVNG